MKTRIYAAPAVKGLRVKLGGVYSAEALHARYTNTRGFARSCVGVRKKKGVNSTTFKGCLN